MTCFTEEGLNRIKCQNGFNFRVGALLVVALPLPLIKTKKYVAYKKIGYYSGRD